MKKNRLFMLGIVTVFVAILSLTLVSSTFAKYTSTVTGGDSARVAKWAFTYTNDLKSEVTSVSEKIEFDLFNVLKDSDGTSDETDIDNDDGSLIAPGTSGSYTLDFTNASEVNATYKVDFTSEETVEQIKYSKDGTNWVETIAQLNIGTTDIEMGDTASITIYWKWDFNADPSNDASDTADGVAGNVQHAVNVSVTWEQAD